MHLNVSIVTYKNDVLQLKRTVNCIIAESTSINKIYVIDNSPTDKIGKICLDRRVEYVFNDANVGFGKAHNIGIKQAIKSGAKYHLILNPDIYFEKETLKKLYDFMENNPDIGLVMPKILYPDGSMQHLCKLLPTPSDLIRRRFFPSNSFFCKKNGIYELRFTDYNKTMDVPYLSGCFMFLRVEALKKAGLFDERFFMYLEDVDLSRRIHKYYRTVYHPDVSVFHQYEKGSYKNITLLKYHVQSAIRYFNKWGYFFDKERQEINNEILQKLKTL